MLYTIFVKWRNDRMKKIFKCLITCLISLFSIVAMSQVTHAEENDDVRTYKVYAICIDPELHHPTGGLFGNGKNTIRMSEYMKFNPQVSVDFMKNSLQDASHGTVRFEVETVRVSDFQRYTNSRVLNDADYFKLFPVQANGYGDWYKGITTDAYNNYVKNFGEFDYEYFIKALNLAEKRRNGDFDMVWIFGSDPLSPYETCMAGRKSFRVNGKGFYADCDNFIIATLTYSRKDGSLEDIGHLAENMLKYVYNTDTYGSNKVDGSNYAALNDWQKFSLCKYNATANTTSYGLGLVHFSPNSTKDYEWNSDTPVSSSYPDFKNNATTTFTASSAYLGQLGNWFDTSSPDFRFSSKDCVAHHMWWFSAMPHFKGRDADGYSKNWWEYIYAADYVNSLSAVAPFANNKLTLNVGDEADLAFVANYYSGKAIQHSASSTDAPIYVDTQGAFEYQNGHIRAVASGQGAITVKYDGRVLNLTVVVKEIPTEAPTEKVTEAPTKEQKETIAQKPTVKPNNNNTTTKKKNDSGMIIAISVYISIAAVIITIIVTITHNKKK